MSNKNIQVAVVGATGYVGSEIIRLLATHPCAKVTYATSERSDGKLLSSQCSWLGSDLTLEKYSKDKINADYTFLCGESGFAMKLVPELTDRTRVIDMSADFRLKDLDIYQEFYKIEHASPELKAVYGLPEWVQHEDIQSANLIANPGCYPTATLLALMPLVKKGCITGMPVVDAKSGMSGAGRSKKDTDFLFTELSGGFKAYAPVRHRHTPEIEQMLGQKVRFTPHLLPTSRGIEATIHVPVNLDSAEAINDVLKEAYQGSKFVRVVSEPPSTKQVHGSNRCDIFATYDDRTGYAVLLSVIDNLVKGASGQAIQNMNIMAGLPEETGLPLNGVWP